MERLKMLYEYCSSYEHEFKDMFKRYDETDNVYCGNYPYEHLCQYSKLDENNDAVLCLKPSERKYDTIDDYLDKQLDLTGALE